MERKKLTTIQTAGSFKFINGLVSSLKKEGIFLEMPK